MFKDLVFCSSLLFYVFLYFTLHIQLTSKMLLFHFSVFTVISQVQIIILSSLDFCRSILTELLASPYLCPLHFHTAARNALKMKKQNQQNKTNPKQMIMLDFWVKPFPLRITLSESLTKLFKKTGRYSRIQEWPSPFYAQLNIFNQTVLLLTLGWLSHPSSIAEGSVHTSMSQLTTITFFFGLLVKLVNSRKVEVVYVSVRKSFPDNLIFPQSSVQ